MPCEFMDGMIICSRGSRQPRCRCGAPSTKLCDFPLTGEKTGKTCDRPLCDRCTVSAGPDLDYCEPHAKLKGVSA